MTTQRSTQQQNIDGNPPRQKKGPMLVLAMFVAGLVVGLALFGWYLTPVEIEGVAFENLDKEQRDAFLFTLVNLYYHERDLDRIRSMLADWPAAGEAICQLWAETDDDAIVQRITTLATGLNGQGCMRVLYSQSGEGPEIANQMSSGQVILLTGLSVTLAVLLLAIGFVWRRLSARRREEAAAAALAGVSDDGKSAGILGRVFGAPFTLFVIRRLLAIPITLIILTAVIFAIISIADPAERASLYLPPRTPSFITPERMAEIVNQIIEERGLDDPFPLQYARWMRDLLRGDWGWSPILQDDVLPALLRRTGVTLELTLYTLLVFIPLGFMSGVRAGWRANSARDHRFRLTAFIAASLPPFILGLFLLSIFYVGLGWFPPGRTAIFSISLSTSTFTNYTGLLTIDGLLNGRLDVTFDALRHLVLPVFVLSLFHWATLGRITRTSIIEVKDADYITAARARGISPHSLLWRHSLRNAISPGLTSSSLAVAPLVTGVFIIEVIFGLHGLSELALLGMQNTPDAALALGFAVYTALLVLPFMFILDIIRAAIDPRADWGEG